MKAQIQELISLGKTEEALKLLEQLTTDAVLLQSRYNGAKRQHSMGLIDFSEWSRTEAQINYAALEMVNSVKEKNMIVIQQNIINITMTSKSFEDAVKSLNFNQLHEQCMKEFKNEPKLLEQVYNLFEPIQRLLMTGQPLKIGIIDECKKSLVTIFTDYSNAQKANKSSEQKDDLNAILSILETEVNEDTLIKCFKLLEVYFVSNPEIKGLDQLRERKKKLQTGESEQILREMERLQPRINQERTWIVEVVNRIIQGLEN